MVKTTGNATDATTITKKRERTTIDTIDTTGTAAIGTTTTIMGGKTSAVVLEIETNNQEKAMQTSKSRGESKGRLSMRPAKRSGKPSVPRSP